MMNPAPSPAACGLDPTAGADAADDTAGDAAGAAGAAADVDAVGQQFETRPVANGHGSVKHQSMGGESVSKISNAGRDKAEKPKTRTAWHFLDSLLVITAVLRASHHVNPHHAAEQGSGWGNSSLFNTVQV